MEKRFAAWAIDRHTCGVVDGVRACMGILELHKKLDKTMIYVTHNQAEAITMADKIVVLQAGMIEQVGRPLELYRAPRNKFVAGFNGSPKMSLVIRDEAGKHGGTVFLTPDDAMIHKFDKEGLCIS